MLELPAELDVVAARRQRHLLVHLLLGLGHEAADVAAADVAGDVIRRWPHSRVIVDGPSTTSMSASRDSGNRSPAGGRRPGSTRSPPGSSRMLVRQPHHEREPQLAFDDLAQRLAADRLDEVEDGLGRHAVAGELVLLRP